VKESKFIELLNLYIDQQISPEEAAALEQEILQDARRRRIYHQYCRMHRACSLVFENFRSQAEPATVETVRQAGEMVEFGAKPRRFAWGYYAVGLAAAACVALVALQVFVRPAAPTAKGATAARPAAVSTGATLVTAVPVRVDAPAPAGYGQPTAAFVAQRLVLFSPTGSQNPSSLVIVAERDPSPPLSTAKVAPRSLRPSIEQFVFEPPSTGNDNPPVLRIRQTTDAQAEMAAYQFQR
jgi:anti-sigma factor RsiW